MTALPASLTSVNPASAPERAAVVAVWLDARDDVATALRALDSGERVRVRAGNEERVVIAREAIPLGHKIALRALDTGARIRKYGEFIGRLTADVDEGGWVHTHNLATAARRTTADELAWREQAAPPGGVRVAPPEAAVALATNAPDVSRYIAHRVHGVVHARAAVGGAAALFADLGGLPGEPVATAVDAEGHVWVALWDAGALLRYDPQGSLVRVIRLPASRPTSIAFAAPGSSELYVGTSREGLTAERLATEPLAGATLALDAGVAGASRAEEHTT